MNDFPRLLEDFFVKYLPVERGCTTNTIQNYRDTFVCFLEYMKSECGVTAERVKMEHFEFDSVSSFLNWLENAKGISTSTRNNRLAAIKSFLKYVGYREPKYLSLSTTILEMKSKKTEITPMNYLTVQAWEILLKSFDLSDNSGLRDFCIIAMLYETGARVSELISIRQSEVRVDGVSTAVLHGKGGKTRIVPIDKTLAQHIQKYISLFHITKDEFLFMNSQRKQLTRRGIDYILQKYFRKAKEKYPEMFPKTISPHCLRHSRPMHLLENDVQLIYIRDLLGHSSVTTTEIYSKANPEIKRKHIMNATKLIIDKEDYSEEQKADLLSWLKNNI